MPEKKQKCPAGAPLWMTTFTDLALLLLTFFVLLLSMASMDPVKMLKAQESLKDAFGWEDSISPEFKIPVLPSPPDGKFSLVPREAVTKHYKQIKSDLRLSKINHQVELLEKDNDTIILRIDNSVLFAPGSAVLHPASYPMLRKIADIIRPLPLLMRIEGHTDDTPFTRDGINNNWELSVDRGVAVMRFYNKGQLVSLDQMSAVGYGYARPLVPNTSLKNRAKNRRVDFVLRSNVVPRERTVFEPILPF